MKILALGVGVEIRSRHPVVVVVCSQIYVSGLSAKEQAEQSYLRRPRQYCWGKTSVT